MRGAGITVGICELPLPVSHDGRGRKGKHANHQMGNSACGPSKQHENNMEKRACKARQNAQCADTIQRKGVPQSLSTHDKPQANIAV